MTDSNDATVTTATQAAAQAVELTQIKTLLLRLEEQSAAQTALAKKRLFWSRFTALFLAVAVALMAGRVIPAVENTLSRADVTLDHIAIIAQQLEAADIPGVLDNLNQTLNEGRESLNEASESIQEISTIDFAALNAAILDLQKLVKNPLGSIFSRG